MPSRLVAGTWVVALTGFVLYVLNFDSVGDAHGGLAASAVSILWLTGLGVLYHVTPKLRARPRVLEPQAEGSTALDHDPTTTELARTVASALQSESARASMASALSKDPVDVGGLLSAPESGLVDWGFTYGVAWAAARARFPLESDGQIAARALAIAEIVSREHRDAEVSA